MLHHFSVSALQFHLHIRAFLRLSVRRIDTVRMERRAAVEFVGDLATQCSEFLEWLKNGTYGVDEEDIRTWGRDIVPSEGLNPIGQHFHFCAPGIHGAKIGRFDNQRSEIGIVAPESLATEDGDLERFATELGHLLNPSLSPLRPTRRSQVSQPRKSTG